MPSVNVDERKPFEVSHRNFKRSCEKAKIKQEFKNRKHYVTPTEKRKIAKGMAITRAKTADRKARRNVYKNYY